MTRNKQPRQEDPASWLTTFGDLATLLLTFYVLIWASSTYRPGEWETARGAIERMLGLTAGKSAYSLVAGNGDGPLGGYRGVIPLMTSIGDALDFQGRDGARAVEELVQLAQSERYQEYVWIEPRERGLSFRIAEPVAFARGGADLLPESRVFLGPLARIIRAAPVSVEVEGHTCDLPISAGRFNSNWDLSAARAAEVVRLLIQEGIGEASISAVACGEHHPLAVNADEQSRRRNRRVEIQLNFL